MAKTLRVSVETNQARLAFKTLRVWNRRTYMNRSGKQLENPTACARLLKLERSGKMNDGRITERASQIFPHSFCPYTGIYAMNDESQNPFVIRHSSKPMIFMPAVLATAACIPIGVG